MLESLESRVRFAKENTEKFQADPKLPWLLESVVYQLELALHDIAGFRLAHPEVIEHGEDRRSVGSE